MGGLIASFLTSGLKKEVAVIKRGKTAEVIMIRTGNISLEHFFLIKLTA